MKREQIGRTGGDETAPFDVYEYEAKTAYDFVREVLESEPKEWGYIIANGQRIEYRYGKLLNEVPERWKRLVIRGVKASGGWSSMDYHLDCFVRYLSDEEVAPLVNCLTCKNCLPPGMRINGSMCKLDKCFPERA